MNRHATLSMHVLLPCLVVPPPLPCTCTHTTALGGVCPAPRPRGMGVSDVRLSLTSPVRGTPWAPKALFGSERQAQSPKPLRSMAWEGTRP